MLSRSAVLIILIEWYKCGAREEEKEVQCNGSGTDYHHPELRKILGVLTSGGLQNLSVCGTMQLIPSL